MTSDIDMLTEREKQALRLLVDGHDAKSSARELNLSVHAINDRLRQARRKLGVSSSREAARLLAEYEDRPPQNPAHKEFGVAASASVRADDEWLDGRKAVAVRHSWLSGGIFIMLAIIAAALVYATFGANGSGQELAMEPASQVTASTRKSQSVNAASAWVGLLDKKNYSESWRRSGALFRSQITMVNWTATVEVVLKPLGSVTSRKFQKVTQTTSLPGAPVGQYEIIEFATNFEGKPGSVETVVMAREQTGWKVVGYFVR